MLNFFIGTFPGFFQNYDFDYQALTNCMHSYNCVRNVPINGITGAQKFVNGIDLSV